MPQPQQLFKTETKRVFLAPYYTTRTCATYITLQSTALQYSTPTPVKMGGGGGLLTCDEQATDQARGKKRRNARLCGL
jgi:hypothetical protein